MMQSGSEFGRRAFLRRSTLLAAAVGLFQAAPGLAQETQQKPEAPSEKPAEGGSTDAPAKKELVDKQGREYRVCDVCGGNMYKQADTWTCEQCGFSYTE